MDNGIVVALVGVGGTLGGVGLTQATHRWNSTRDFAQQQSASRVEQLEALFVELVSTTDALRRALRAMWTSREVGDNGEIRGTDGESFRAAQDLQERVLGLISHTMVLGVGIVGGLAEQQLYTIPKRFVPMLKDPESTNEDWLRFERRWIDWGSLMLSHTWECLVDEGAPPTRRRSPEIDRAKVARRLEIADNYSGSMFGHVANAEC
ncbi:hypothetical protein GCM10023349_24120 [Nocardioides conyzicola]|uniref:Uncharacterized protein n=2 Tax=Nocardioides conyzicola TaxID=1651781 RepID=A0ABP8XG50_9ACTN